MKTNFIGWCAVNTWIILDLVMALFGTLGWVDPTAQNYAWKIGVATAIMATQVDIIKAKREGVRTALQAESAYSMQQIDEVADCANAAVDIKHVARIAFIRRINKLPLRVSAGVVVQAAEERCRLPLMKGVSKRRTSSQIPSQ